MRAVIHAIDSGASRGQLLAHPPVHTLQLDCRNQTFGHTALVAHHDHTKPRSIEAANGLHHTREKLDFLPARDVLAFNGSSVYYSVTIQKYSFVYGVHGKSSAPPVPRECG